MNWQKWFLAAALTLGFNPLVTAQGFTPSAAQIEQFKNLSPAQQQQMAKTAGIDIKEIGLGSQTNNQPQLNQKQNRKPNTQHNKKRIYRPNDEDKEHIEINDDNQDRAKLSLFGHSIFHEDLESFQPATNIPVPANYIMGPGDTIVVQLYGKDNSTHSLTVNREGQIQFPQIGPISFAGLSFTQAQALIKETVKQQMIGIKASITMGTLRSIRIFVLGEVKRPGSFTVGSLSTMTNALFASGGISDVGSLRNIQLKRQGQVITQLDLYNLLLNGDTSHDSRLLPGDVIFVPPIGATVSIDGSINRPAIYELKNQTTVGSLIQFAGGLQNNAHLPASQIIRFDDFGEKDLINIDLSKKSGKSQNLRNGDLIVIPEKLDLISQQVKLSGHIKREGFRPWTPGLRFSDLVPSVLNLPPQPDLDTALIQRFDTKTGKVSALLFSPSKAWAHPKSKSNPTLQDYDVIQLFNFNEPRPAQLKELLDQLSNQSQFGEIKKVVSISGSVRFPGAYPLAENMSSQDLIQLAGGLTESALDTDGEITRYGIDQNRQRKVTHINVNFNSTPSPLKAGDTLQVKQVPLWKKKETVTITGEVIFPGTYSILPGETLTQVLDRAGGFTPHAYPLGAVFSREGLRALEQQRLAELKKQLEGDLAAANANDDDSGSGNLDAEEAETLLKNLDSIKPAGRMVINLPKIVSNPKNHDFQLENGDAISIPRYKPSVTVVGEIQYPTSHFFQSSLDAMEYIDRSGGFKKHADQSRVYIVKANGRVIQPDSSAWFKADTELIQAGDTIVVPLETDKVYSITVWTKVTQIAYQAALGAAAINGL